MLLWITMEKLWLQGLLKQVSLNFLYGEFGQGLSDAMVDAPLLVLLVGTPTMHVFQYINSFFGFIVFMKAMIKGSSWG